MKKQVLKTIKYPLKKDGSIDWEKRFEERFEDARDQNDKWNLWEDDVRDFIRELLKKRKT